MPPPNTPEEYFEGEYQHSPPSSMPSPHYQLHRDQVLPNNLPPRTIRRTIRSSEILPRATYQSRAGASSTSSSPSPLADQRIAPRDLHPRSPVEQPRQPQDRLRNRSDILHGTVLQEDEDNSNIDNDLSEYSENGALSSDHLALDTSRQAATIDYHCLEYVDPYDDNLDCPICHSPLVEPVILRCEHVFCLKCITQSAASSETCPIDRQPIGTANPQEGSCTAKDAPPVIRNQLDNLKVKCPNRHCDHVCRRGSLEHHYSECGYTKTSCPDSNCDKLVARKDTESGDCLHQEVFCPDCGEPVDKASLDEHYDKDCYLTPVLCEHCQTEVPRHRHYRHSVNCAERKIKCKFSLTGCSYQAREIEFGRHEQSCIYGLVLRMDQSHRAEVEDLKNKLHDTQEHVRKLRIGRPAGQQVSPPYFSTDGNIHPSLSGLDGSPGPVTERPRAVPIPLEGHTTPEAKLAHALATIDVFDAKMENLEKYVGELDGRQAHMLMNDLGPVKEQVLDLRNSVGQLSMYVRWLMESVRQTTKRPGAGNTLQSSEENESTLARTSTQGSQRGSDASSTTPSRRMSDRENPPRL